MIQFILIDDLTRKKGETKKHFAPIRWLRLQKPPPLRLPKPPPLRLPKPPPLRLPKPPQQNGAFESPSTSSGHRLRHFMYL